MDIIEIDQPPQDSLGDLAHQIDGHVPVLPVYLVEGPAVSGC